MRATREQRDAWHCWHFAVTRDDVRRRGTCSYYGDPYPDGAINWIGPQPRPGMKGLYCDHHWEQVQAEQSARTA